MNKKYDNNNIIIASRAYFLQSPTCTRANSLVILAHSTPMTFWCYSYALLVVNLINGSDTFRSVCICISFASARITHLVWDGIVKTWSSGETFVSWPRLCCHYCHTIELHGTNTLRTTPSSFAASRAVIYLALVAASVTMLNIETHQSPHRTFFHLIVPPYNSKELSVYMTKPM
jgi:hypothetical protein